MTPSHPIRLPQLSSALAAIGIGLGFAAAPVSAQTLGQLYDVARDYDAAYLSTRAQAESVQYRAEQALALRRPSVSFGAGVTRTVAGQPATITTSRTAVGTSRQRADTDSGQTALQAQLTLQQTLFNRPNDKTIEQAALAVEAAQAQLRASEQDLMVRLTQAYFDVLGARDTLSTVQTSKKAISEQLASAKRNFEVGTATITDTREAQARFDLAVAQELAADNDLRVKQLALDNLVGRRGVDPRPLAVPLALPAPTPSSVDDWVQQSEANSPAIQSSRLALDVARAETEKAKSAGLPTVGLTASLARPYTRSSSTTRDSVPGTGTTIDVKSGHVDGLGENAAIGVNLSMPLYAGESIQNRVKETIALEEKARNDLDAARRTTAQTTRSAFFGTQSGLAQVKALEAAESSSKLALEATQLGYKVGVRVNLDVLNAQTQLYTTQRDLAKARYDAIVAGLRLRQAAGTLTGTDLQSVDNLLAR